jgi:hypothetical protein
MCERGFGRGNPGGFFLRKYRSCMATLLSVTLGNRNISQGSAKTRRNVVNSHLGEVERMKL